MMSTAIIVFDRVLNVALIRLLEDSFFLGTSSNHTESVREEAAAPGLGLAHETPSSCFWVSLISRVYHTVIS